MKRKLSLLLTTILIISFTYQNEYKFTEVQVVKIHQKLQVLNSILPESEMPSKTANQHIKESTELMKLIEDQFNRFHPDTTKKR